MTNRPNVVLFLVDQCREARCEMRSRLIGWSDATGDMFKWKWVRGNFPEPTPPLPRRSP
jgi:hypothetical protein